MSRPVLEFVSLKRPLFELTSAELVVGRAPGCAVSVEGEGVSDQHVRISVDPHGGVYVQDLDSFSGTLRNGQFVYGRQQLADGDELKIGSVVMRFRSTAPAPEMVRQTLVGVGPPPELSAAYAGRTVEMAPVHDEDVGVIVGTPDPEPTNNRTMQMDSSAIEALLAADAAKNAQKAAPAFEDESATMATPPPSFDDKTIGADPRGRVAYAPTMPPGGHMLPPAAASTGNQAGNQARTMMAEAPVLPKPGALPQPPQGPMSAPAPSPANQARTMMFEAPVLPTNLPMPPGPRPPTATGPMAPNAPVAPQASVPTAPSQLHQPPQAATMMAEAPVLPAHLPTPPQAQPQGTAQMPAPVMPQGAAYAPIKTPQSTPQVAPSLTGPYVPPEKGPFGSFSRAIAFVGQMFALAKQERAIIKPIFWDLMITTPLNIGLAVAMGFVHSSGAAYGLMALGITLLYFTDYVCNSFTASLMYDYVTTGHADMDNAKRRVKKSLSGILVFAAVSSLLEVAGTYARERNDIVAKILFGIMRAIWTTATYIIMPAMIIEGVPFGAAFKRSKELMEKDPTGVGAGVVALSLASYILGLVVFSLAYFSLRFGGKIHPAVGGILFFTLVNLYWALTGWLKIAYSTCFYMWARECERSGSTDHALAPRPLRAAIDAG